MTETQRPKVIIIGAGFGGLFTARQLANTAVDVLIIDRENYHTFTPLIYQVATCGLDVDDVAYPVRKIFAEAANVDFLLGEVLDIHTDTRHIEVSSQNRRLSIAYDYLIVAVGSVTNYFGNETLAAHSFGLKNMRDAVALRNHILKQFELANTASSPQAVTALTTFVVVGGGPTGLETAGALYELYQHVLRRQYHQLEGVEARVILVEASDALLRPYPQTLQAAALKQLQALGVEVRLERSVKAAEAGKVILDDGSEIATQTLIWSAGVQGAPLARQLGVGLARGGRIAVSAGLEVVGVPRVYAVGDVAYLEDESGNPYPQLIPVAQQQAKLAAQNILRDVRNLPPKPFRYADKGTMATIGRRRAVAWLFNRVPLSGFLAWLAWLGLHLVTLMGFRNRVSVFMSWVWNYLTYDRAASLILDLPAQTDARRAPSSATLEPHT